MPRPLSHRPRPRPGRWLLTLALVALAGACGGDPTPTAAPTASAPAGGVTPGPTPTDIDPTLLQPLTMLGPCTAEPNVLDEEPVEGALLPPGAVMTSQQTDGPLTTIKGYVEMTPIQVRYFYQRQEDYEVLQMEDEIQESETLLGDGNNRLFVKAQAICELGSVLLAVVAPEGQGQVPAPAGGAGQTPGAGG